MFKKTMTFDDLNGDPVTQTFYFNYSKKEIAELLELKDLEGKLTLLTTPIEESGLTQVENSQQAYDIFQDLILDAYGEKGADNVTFKKTPELREWWGSHVAFVEMIFEFLENTELVQEFIEKALPPKLVAKAKAEIAADEARKVSSTDITKMVHEADALQKDPATRIEPGVMPPNADPVIAELAGSVANGKKVSDLTEEDLLSMPEEQFKALNPRDMTTEQMQVAFRRKLS